MRKLAFVFALAALFVGSAQAATVDIVAKETAPGTWELLYTSAVALESINVTAVGPTALTFNSPPVNIPFSFASDFGLGGLSVSASRGLASDPALPAGVLVSLGTFTGAVTALNIDGAVGGTVFLDGQVTPFADFSLAVMPIVPEPSSIVLMGLALGGLAFARRRA